MKVEARIDLHNTIQGPDPYDEDWGACPPANHVICRDVDGTPHFVSDFVWPWTAYTPHQTTLVLHFFYWKPSAERLASYKADITPERKGRIRELQFLMTRQIYYGANLAARTLHTKNTVLGYLARFAEARSLTIREVLTTPRLQDAFNETLPGYYAPTWISLYRFFRQLNNEQIGYTIATPSRWHLMVKRANEIRSRARQFPPLPTRIYGAIINNLSKELDEVEANKSRLIAALHEAGDLRRRYRAIGKKSFRQFGFRLIEEFGLGSFLQSRGYTNYRLSSLAAIVSEIFQLCKLQIHAFSGMREEEARNLPYHCMIEEEGLQRRKHYLIAGATTKLNNGKCLRTKWVTTDLEGFRAIRIAQDFAAALYKILEISPNNWDDPERNFLLFPSPNYLPWKRYYGQLPENRIPAFRGDPTDFERRLMLSRLCPQITEADIEELEAIDPFRAWREEPQFAIGNYWPLSTHQLRRSLAVYANASGLVRLSSLRRQLQHLSLELTLYYGRGSVFCKNFVEIDPEGYKNHIASEWQDGAEEAEIITFERDVLNCAEPMFGGAGTFFQRQRERGEVMSREDVSKQKKAGLLAYRESPLGGCTRPDTCEARKGLQLVNIACATESCKHLIGKHSKIIETIRLKRAAMARITPGSIAEAMEQEELKALEQVELKWRP